MTVRTVKVELPEHICAYLRQVAQFTGRPLESIVWQSIMGNLPEPTNPKLEAMRIDLMKRYVYGADYEA